MKKIIAIASVLAAVAAQAATVNWTVNKQTELAGYNYAIVDTAAVTALLTGGSSPYPDAAALALDVAAGKAYDADALANLAATGTVNARGTVASRSIENVGDSFTVIFWNGTAADGGAFYYGTFSTANMTYSPPNSKPGDVVVTYSALTSGAFKEAYAVPEPTTVALLALGLAAVGLKRKVA